MSSHEEDFKLVIQPLVQPLVGCIVCFIGSPIELTEVLGELYDSKDFHNALELVSPTP